MSIRMDQPRPFDLVGSPVLIAGIGTGFEATISFRAHDGHDEVTGPITVGGGTGEHAQFQVKAKVAGAAFKLDRVFVEVFEVSAKDGSERQRSRGRCCSAHGWSRAATSASASTS